MNNDISINEIIRDVNTYIYAAQKICDDLAFSNGNDLIYNIDFSLLYPYLWPDAPASIPPYKSFGKRVFDTLINTPKAKPNFTLVFTGPSFCELLDQIIHKVKQYNRTIYAIGDLSKRIQQVLNKRKNLSDWKTSLIRAGFAIDDLEVFVDAGFTEHVREPIKKAIQLFSHKDLFKGLGDVVEEYPEIKSLYKRAFYDLYERMKEERPSWPNETRSPEHREFHYKVDTANIVASTALNGRSRGKRSVFFITDSQLRHAFCHRDGRSALVPTFWVSSLLLNRSYVGNINDFFTDMSDSGKALLKKVQTAKSLDQIAGYKKKAISEFYNRFIIPLQTTQSSPLQDNDNLSQDIIMDALNNPKEFKERLATAKDELIAGGRSLIELEPQILEDGLFEIMKGSGDPIVERIRNMFKV